MYGVFFPVFDGKNRHIVLSIAKFGFFPETIDNKTTLCLKRTNKQSRQTNKNEVHFMYTMRKFSRCTDEIIKLLGILCHIRNLQLRLTSSKKIKCFKLNAIVKSLFIHFFSFYFNTITI